METATYCAYCPLQPAAELPDSKHAFTTEHRLTSHGTRVVGDHARALCRWRQRLVHQTLQLGQLQRLHDVVVHAYHTRQIERLNTKSEGQQVSQRRTSRLVQVLDFRQVVAGAGYNHNRRLCTGLRLPVANQARRLKACTQHTAHSHQLTTLTIEAAHRCTLACCSP